MAKYQFVYTYHLGSINECSECATFPDAVKYAADQFALLQEEGAVDPEIGGFMHVDLIHDSTGYDICRLDQEALKAIKFSTRLFTQLSDSNYRTIRIEMVIGGTNFIEQVRDLLGLIADSYLSQFNIPDSEFAAPCTYLNVNDAKRDLQYIVEFCKIAQFQLQGNESLHW